jgi:hypothetical protein
MAHPDSYYAKLYFGDLVKNALRAEKFYHNSYTIVPGDANADGVVDMVDLIYVIHYLFLKGNSPLPLRVADVNADCMVDIEDVVYLINYILRGGPPLLVGCAKS